MTAAAPSVEIDRGRDILRRSRGVVVLTGAGLSADSGLATFRGPGGQWRKHRPEDLATPEAFLGGDAVSGVRALRMRLGAPDAEGRQSPRPIPDSSFTLPCDLAIKALGFEAEDLPAAFAAPRLKLTRHGTLKVAGNSRMTSLDGVFAAGDITRGASLVVWAIKEGRDAADGIDAYLRAKTRAVA